MSGYAPFIKKLSSLAENKNTRSVNRPWSVGKAIKKSGTEKSRSSLKKTRALLVAQESYCLGLMSLWKPFQGVWLRRPHASVGFFVALAGMGGLKMKIS